MKLSDSTNQRLDELYARYNCDEIIYSEYLRVRDLIISENKVVNTKN